MDDLNALYKIVGNDFELEEQGTEQRLRDYLIGGFAYLIDHDLSKMMNILYRADVNEEQLKERLGNSDGIPPAEIIALAYLERQKAKIETRKKYSR